MRHSVGRPCATPAPRSRCQGTIERSTGIGRRGGNREHDTLDLEAGIKLAPDQIDRVEESRETLQYKLKYQAGIDSVVLTPQNHVEELPKFLISRTAR